LQQVVFWIQQYALVLTEENLDLALAFIEIFRHAQFILITIY
jgi:hypothetical protein